MFVMKYESCFVQDNHVYLKLQNLVYSNMADFDFITYLHHRIKWFYGAHQFPHTQC